MLTCFGQPDRSRLRSDHFPFMQRYHRPSDRYDLAWNPEGLMQQAPLRAGAGAAGGFGPLTQDARTAQRSLALVERGLARRSSGEARRGSGAASA